MKLFIKSIILSGFLLYNSISGHAQTDVFQKTYHETLISGTNQRHIGYELQETSDEGFIIGGVYKISSAHHFYLFKTDSLGNRQWTGTMQGDSLHGKSIRQTSDSGYIMCGDKGASFSDGNSIVIIKYTSTGGISWRRSYNLGKPDSSIFLYNSANCIRQTSDGGYILTGYSKANPFFVTTTERAPSL